MDSAGDVNNGNSASVQQDNGGRSWVRMQPSQCRVVSTRLDSYSRPPNYHSLHFEAGPSPRLGTVQDPSMRVQSAYCLPRSAMQSSRVLRSNRRANDQTDPTATAPLQTGPDAYPIEVSENVSPNVNPTPSHPTVEPYSVMTSTSTSRTSTVCASSRAATTAASNVHTASSNSITSGGGSSTSSYLARRIPRYYMRGGTVTSPPRVMSVTNAALNGRHRSTTNPVASRALTGGTNSHTNITAGHPATAPCYPSAPQTTRSSTTAAPVYVAYQQHPGMHRLVRSSHTVGHATAPLYGSESQQPGLNYDLLCRLPTHLHRRKTDDELLTEENKCCPICRGDYTEEDRLRLLPCLHSFHQTCVDEWFKRDSRCPSCRTDTAEGILKAAEQSSPLLARQTENCENTDPDKKRTSTGVTGATYRSSRSRGTATNDLAGAHRTARDSVEDSDRLVRRRRAQRRRHTTNTSGETHPTAAEATAPVQAENNSGTYASSSTVQSPTTVPAGTGSGGGRDSGGCDVPGTVAQTGTIAQTGTVRRRAAGATREQQLRLGLVVLRQSPLVERMEDGGVVGDQNSITGTRRRRHEYTGAVDNSVLREDVQAVEPRPVSSLSAASSWDIQARQALTQYLYGASSITPATHTGEETVFGSLLRLCRFRSEHQSNQESADSVLTGAYRSNVVCSVDGCMGSFKRFMVWAFNRDSTMDSNPEGCARLAHPPSPAPSRVLNHEVATGTIAGTTTDAATANRSSIADGYFEAGSDDMLIAVVEPYWLQTSSCTNLSGDVVTGAAVAVVNSNCAPLIASSTAADQPTVDGPSMNSFSKSIESPVDEANGTHAAARSTGVKSVQRGDTQKWHGNYNSARIIYSAKTSSRTVCGHNADTEDSRLYVAAATSTAQAAAAGGELTKAGGCDVGCGKSSAPSSASAVLPVEEHRLVALDSRSSVVNEPLTPKMPPHCCSPTPLLRSVSTKTDLDCDVPSRRAVVVANTQVPPAATYHPKTHTTEGVPVSPRTCTGGANCQSASVNTPSCAALVDSANYSTAGDTKPQCSGVDFGERPTTASYDAVQEW